MYNILFEEFSFISFEIELLTEGDSEPLIFILPPPDIWSYFFFAFN